MIDHAAVKMVSETEGHTLMMMRVVNNGNEEDNSDAHV